MLTASIDFGTTNSVAGLNNQGEIQMVPLGKDRLETKSVLFYSFEDKNFYVGDDAIEELEMETMGRYLVALKSFLGSEEEIETTLGTTTYTLSDLISIILRRFKGAIEQQAQQPVEHLVLGRPVHFNDTDIILDQQAQDRLERAALQAGFKEVVFEYEPIAASLAYEEKINQEELILVADIGGGTTDYTIVRVGTQRHNNRKEDILATHGTYIGGNSFDSQIIKNFIIPHLGYQTPYTNMGKSMQIGPALYGDFSEWHKFQKMYDPQIIHAIEKLIQMAQDPIPIGRLLEMIKEGLYFPFSQKIIQSKMELSNAPLSQLNMDIFEHPFKLELSENAFNQIIQEEVYKIRKTLDETLKQAGVHYQDIDRVFLTGGSTLVPAVRNIYASLFSEEKLIHTDVLSSVGYGLAIAAGRVW